MGSVAHDLELVGVEAEVPDLRLKPTHFGTNDSQLGASAEPGRVFDVVIREVLGAILRVVAQSPELRSRLSLLAQGTGSPTGALLVTKRQYGERVGYCVRKLDQLVKAGLPTIGKGRSLRIPVAEADRWVLAHLSSQERADDQLDVAALANAARRRRRRAL